VSAPDPIIVEHQDAAGCPGHDIQPILADKSREVGWCLCIHPFMQMIDFSGFICRWCRQPTTRANTSAEAKQLRTDAVRAVLGTDPAKCPSLSPSPPGGEDASHG
jgi:hypothetical protein